MRSTVQFTVTGKNVKEIVSNATTRWKKYINDDSADLPYDTELQVSDVDGTLESDMVAKVTIRAKMEEAQ